jgi:amino acid transporter
MSTTPHLSLLSAIIININIMLGSGIFVNTILLASQTGALGSLAYALVGLLFLPLILSFSQLLSDVPGGSFYEFGATVHPALGFLNSWVYFMGKLATPAFGIHIFVTLMQTITPSLAIFNPLMLDALIVAIFVILNVINLKAGRNINYVFISLKLIPILFVIFSTFFLFNIGNFTIESLQWENIPAVVPFIIFAFAGFEASCSLSKQIVNPQKNGPRAVLISFAIILIILMTYQASFFGNLGMTLCNLFNWQTAFPELIRCLLPKKSHLHWFLKIITLSGIAASSLGSSYGIIYSNFWNLHILAEHKYVFGSSLLVKKNQYGTPFLCVIISGFIVLCYQLFTKGNQIPLQQISAAGNLMAYSITILSFFIISLRNQRNRFLAITSLISTLLLATSFKKNVAMYGLNALGVFMFVIFAGMGMYLLNTARKNK